MKEWSLIFDSERDILTCRLDLIKDIAGKDTVKFYCYLENLFCELSRSYLEKYNIGVSNINKLCDYLKTAVEEEAMLKENIVFKHNMFEIHSKEDSENISCEIQSLTEDFDDCRFSIYQLNCLMEIFTRAGPYGVINKQALCYILKDMALSNNIENNPYIPERWAQLNECQLIEVLDVMFGPDFIVDWRDFIIYNLNILFPTIYDILKLRERFLQFDLNDTEIISDYQYDQITLWFEDYLPTNPKECLRLAFTKRLIFELFKVEDNSVKYTSFLLYFCKDMNPKIGLTKALSLSIGKCLITSKEELDQILQTEKEINNTVSTLLGNIINVVVNSREGAVIYEVGDTMSDKSEGHSTHSIEVSLETQPKSFVTKSENGEDGSEVSKHNLSEISASNKILAETSKWWTANISINTIESVLNASCCLNDTSFPIMKPLLDDLLKEADENGTILAHSLMSLNCMQPLFEATTKFAIVLPCEIVRSFKMEDEDEG